MSAPRNRLLTACTVLLSATAVVALEESCQTVIDTVTTPATSSSSMSTSSAKWAQHEVTLPAMKRGCHLVTNLVVSKEVAASLRDFKVGLCNVFLQHTSASITINENADPDVRHDMETFLSQAVPEGRGKAPWIHTDEGDDDMPAHVKSSMFGCSLSVPITNGRLNLGTWQGIWLCEHRDRASGRRLVVTLQGV